MDRNLFVLLAALVLGCDVTDTNDTDDTGIETETISVTIEAHLDGVVVDKQPVSLEDAGEILAEGLTGEPIVVKLQNQAHAWIGPIEADLTSDGHRIHNVAGAEYVHRKVTVDTDTTTTPVVVSLNMYIAMNDVTCTVDDYVWYNDQWTYGDSYEYRNVQVDTLDGYHLVMDEEVLDWMVSHQEGRELVIEGSNLTAEGSSSFEATVQEFQYTSNEGTLHVVTVVEEFVKRDLTCQ